MCKAIDDMRKESWEEGKEEGIELGHNEKLTECILNLMETMKWTASQSMDALKIPVSERSKYNIPVM